MSTLPQRTYDYTKYNLKINNLISFQKPVNSGEGETISKLYNGIEKIAIENQKIKKVINFKWIEKNRNSIASCLKLLQFITMNVIDGQAGRVRYYSLIFYSLTINNILNIVILFILAGISISALTQIGLLKNANKAKTLSRYSDAKETINLKLMEIETNCYSINKEYNIKEIATGMKDADNIMIEKYYNSETANIKNGIN